VLGVLLNLCISKYQIVSLKNHLTYSAWEEMKFGQLIFRDIITFVATRCQILRLNCTKVDFRWGFAPDRARGLTSLPRPSWNIGEGRGEVPEGKREEREGKGVEGTLLYVFFLRIACVCRECQVLDFSFICIRTETVMKCLRA